MLREEETSVIKNSPVQGDSTRTPESEGKCLSIRSK